MSYSPASQKAGDGYRIGAELGIVAPFDGRLQGAMSTPAPRSADSVHLQ
ncbi:MAG: hypothetical protein WAU15_06500 [Nitrosomonas sp.]